MFIMYVENVYADRDDYTVHATTQITSNNDIACTCTI